MKIGVVGDYGVGKKSYILKNKNLTYTIDENIDGVIIMFDVCDIASFKNIIFWILTIKEINTNIPIVLCGNKIESVFRKVKEKQVKKYYGYPYYEISVKNNYNLDAPVSYFIKSKL